MMALADSAALQAVRDWANGKFLVKRVEYNSGAVNWSGGTIGTRAAQNSVNIEVDGWVPVAVSISYVASSSNYLPVVFFNNSASASHYTGVYCNFYRTSTAAYSHATPLRFVVAYVKEVSS